MRLVVASVSSRASRNDPCDALIDRYLARIRPYAEVEAVVYRTEAALLDSLARAPGRVPAVPVLLDSRGKGLSSPEFAQWLGRQRDQGRQRIAFAIGPADGWSDAASLHTKSNSGLLLSFGPITLPHELARVVLCEQIYRAFTILAGHPYHSGH